MKAASARNPAFLASSCSAATLHKSIVLFFFLKFEVDYKPSFIYLSYQWMFKRIKFKRENDDLQVLFCRSDDSGHRIE